MNKTMQLCQRSGWFYAEPTEGANTLGLFKCIVSDLFFYNNQKSATSVFVIPTSVLVISCKSVSSIQKP